MSSSTSLFTGVMIGKINRSEITISVKDGGKKLDIEVLVIGNFGTGGQEAATRLTESFKAKLLEKIRQQ